MTVTYTDDTARNEPMIEEVFVPRYARTRKSRSKGGIRTWMILAPVGVVALIGGGAAVMMSGETGNEPLVAREAPVPLVQPAVPLESSTARAALSTDDLPGGVTLTETAAAPVVREAPPTRPAAIQRRQPVERRAAPAEPAPVMEQAPTEPTGPQPYVATTPTIDAPAPAPSIVPAPLD
ncbi:hypothetical protein [Brevundimonas aurifodinae]|uniref:SPOR domain-containing protein n=2 Tax=Brevundimonas TaxID=41275 RepID=A0ABV1NJQ4_9CAUL|nr:MAG: hypothetical protein B7Z42_07585 [Brevundimonas sp. 12-68-7]OYX31793.1 MAG: hypothetical protein B7Z01_12115 [Brevundimonas subvibrioides]